MVVAQSNGGRIAVEPPCNHRLSALDALATYERKLDAARTTVAAAGNDSWPFPSQPTMGTPSSSSSFPFIREVDTQNYVTVIKQSTR